VQPLICAYHLPRCENDTLVLPSQEMCRLALGPCKLLGMRPEGYPEFLNCSNEKIFPPYCKVCPLLLSPLILQLNFFCRTIFASSNLTQLLRVLFRWCLCHHRLESLCSPTLSDTTLAWRDVVCRVKLHFFLLTNWRGCKD
jgi:hypothetical protein